MSRLAIVGAGGRMGQRLVALAPEVGLTAAAQVDQGGPALSEVDPGGVDAVIDFSVHAQAPGTAAWCAEHGVPLVLGTTGLDPAQREAVAGAAQRVAVVHAPNFSVGVNALFALVGQMAKLLGPGWDLEVVEAHHRHKVDAPSGTARQLGVHLAEARGWDYDDVVRGGRDGLVGARPDREIGMAVVRGGDVVGEHTVLYLSTGEQVSIGHRATDRDIFARGALRAAGWLLAAPRSPGLYSMQDVLRG